MDELQTAGPAGDWHARDLDAVRESLATDPAGLSTAEAARRLAAHGRNRLPPPRRRSPLARFAAQFVNVLIVVLLCSAAITVALGEWTDSAVILGVVLINGLVGFLQEGRAERALEAIGEMLSQVAAVRREGVRIEIATDEVVPGDLVLLQPGDRVPADLRLIGARGLAIEEAVLTGESQPVRKDPAPCAAATALADRRCMAWSGTLVAAGTGAGFVVATGPQTEIGRISTLVSATRSLATPLTRSLDSFARRLSVAIAVLAGAGFAVGTLVHGFAAREMFVAAVAIAVAAIPEGLPAIITIALAIGVTRMARRRAIIRHLPAVETLGAVAIICTDKTGTLTRNEMTVQRMAVGGAVYGVTGTGFDPRGRFLRDGVEAPPASDPVLLELCRAAALCGEATATGAGEERAWHGDPTETALLVLAEKAGLDPYRLSGERPRLDAIPFEPERRYMATLNRRADGTVCLYAKGAPEQLLALCDREAVAGGTRPIDRARWQALAHAFASDGLRVLAVATGDSSRAEFPADRLGPGLVLLGLVGMIDPPRPEAIDAVAQCRRAGIRVKMVTGDHLVTARAVADAMGIGGTGGAVSGAELERMDAAALRDTARQVDVFARASPEHKLRLIEALQADGSVLAMTGDGVNDAPALKRADVGVAMGRCGTAVAREAAEMVLSDDNFASIAWAVEEGRVVYDNIRKAVIYVLPTSVAEGLIVFAAILAGLPMPITPLQILWINMVTAVTLSLALAVEPAEDDVMSRPPRRADEPLLDRLLVWRVAFVSLVLVAGVAGLFAQARIAGAPLPVARSVAVNALVMFEAFYLLSARHIRAPVLNLEGFFGNRVALAAVLAVTLLQLVLTYLPFMQRLFGTAALDVSDWLRLIGVAALIVPLVEAEKYLVRRNGISRAAPPVDVRG